MSKTGKDRMKVAVELVRKGATMLGEPCQQCGGVQVRYHGKTYCTSHEDLSALLTSEHLDYNSVVATMREQVLSKLNDTVAQIEKEKDAAKQDQLVSLMTKYFDLLQKVVRKQETS